MNATTEALYYRAYHSFILQKPEFKENFEILREQFTEYPQSFSSLTQFDIFRIKQMQDAHKSGTMNLFTGSSVGNFSNDFLPQLEKSTKPHKGLVMDIYAHRKTLLEPFTGPIETLDCEFPVIFGNIDLMALSNRCAYIIEVKTDQANHSIVGQCMKYYVGMSLKLILRFWDEVKIITICPGYDEPSYNGLHQINAIPLLIDIPNMKIL